jgi:hypothetical protein
MLLRIGNSRNEETPQFEVRFELYHGKRQCLRDSASHCVNDDRVVADKSGTTV